MNNTVKILMIVFIIMVLPAFIGTLSAQPPPPPDPVGVPIDGGLSLLLAAGVAYGSKKFFSKKKNK